MTNLTRQARFISSQNEGENAPLTFCIISRENDYKRFDFKSGSYYIERLNVAGADFSELNTLFKDHEPSVDNAIAKIDNIREIEGELLCECTFAPDETSQNIRAKYLNGILSDVSIGYEIFSERAVGKDGDLVIREATNFKIYELSAVWKGADKGAKKREMERINELKEAQIKAKNKGRERELRLKAKSIFTLPQASLR